MHAAVKILIGIILLLIGLGLFVNSLPGYNMVPELRTFWLDNFITVLTGVIPICLIILGLFIVWLEADELKTRKELEKEK